MSTDQNKARALSLVEQVLNGHDVEALEQYTSNRAVVGSGSSLVRAFPDLHAEVRWVVADGDMVVAFLDVQGTHEGPWLFVADPSGQKVRTSLTLAFRFDHEGQIVDQWLGSNFIEMLAQLGWGFAPVGEPASLPPH